MNRRVDKYKTITTICLPVELKEIIKRYPKFNLSGWVSTNLDEDKIKKYINE